MEGKNKVRRYKNLVKNFSNWPSYLMFKMLGHQSSFNFQLKNSFSIQVPRNMLGTFRECFFDEIYTKKFPAQALHFQAPTVIDVGANVGYFSLFMFHLYPKAKVYSFEPMPFNYKVLKDYHDSYSAFHWETFPQAISNNNQPITLHASSLDSYTTMASIFEQPTSNKTIQIECSTIPQLLDSHNLKAIDILKLDCEGAEYSILYSLPEEILKNTKVLMIETHKGTQPAENTMAMKSYLEKHGFSLHCLDAGKEGYIWAWMP